MSVSALITKYLDPSVAPIYNEDTFIEPIIDGVDYLTAVFRAIDSTTGLGDLVYITGWAFDDALTVPGFAPIGALLADRAEKGVDVRVIINGGLYFHYTTAVGKPNPFSQNLEAVRNLRALVVHGVQPLENRVLFDWSGQAKTGSHHQKSVLVRAGTDVDAFVSGIDMAANRYDRSPHNTLSWGKEPPPWGWHDVAVRLAGMATQGIWENFRVRWHEARALPDETYLRGPTSGSWIPVREPFNPPATAPTPSTFTAPSVPSSDAAQRAVQVLRSRYPFRRSYLRKPGGEPWVGPPAGGIREIFPVLVRALKAANEYIYIEDQFLADTPDGEGGLPAYSLFPHLLAAAKRDVKVILLSSGRSDPDDPWPGLKNQTLDEAGKFLPTPFTTGDVKKKLIDPLTATGQEKNVVVWRLENALVHAKVIVIDDEFASVGSANFQTRSMFGVDGELQAAFVDARSGTDSIVRSLRMDLWREHLGVASTAPAVESALADHKLALGIWRSTWLPSSAPAGIWRASNTPVGFLPSAVRISLVGPED